MLFLALLATTLASLDAQAQDKRVRFTFMPGSVVTWLVDVANTQGFFAREGIQAELTSVRDGPTALTALVSDSVDITTNSTQLFLGLASRGQKVQIIAGQTSQLVALVGRPQQTPAAPFPGSIASLKGKKIGIQALSSETHYLTNQVLAAAGLKPSDIEFVTGATNAQALVTGTVEAATLVAQQLLIAETLGARILIDLRTSASCPETLRRLCGISQIGMWGRTDWIKANPGLVQGVRKAIASADVFVHDPKNRAKVLASVASHLPADASSELREKYVDYLLTTVTAATRRADIETWSSLAVEQGLIPRAPAVDDLFTPGTPETAQAVLELAR